MVNGNTWQLKGEYVRSQGGKVTGCMRSKSQNMYKIEQSMYTNKKEKRIFSGNEEITRKGVIENKVACGSGANKVAKRSVTLACLVH